MNNVILGSFFNEHGEVYPETLIVSFLNQTLRIRLELGARTSFVVPFKPIVEFIKSIRLSACDSSIKQIAINGHYSNLQAGVNITKGEVLVSYQANGKCEIIGIAAPDCGKIEVRLDRLIPYMEPSLRRFLANL